jgi:uncharacterized radical SAM superfamily protein
MEYAVQYERQLRRVKEEQEEINELLTLGLIRKMLERDRNPNAIQEPPPYNYVNYAEYVNYAVQYERQLRRVKEEQEEINELLTLGLIRKMLERDRKNI